MRKRVIQVVATRNPGPEAAAARLDTGIGTSDLDDLRLAGRAVARDAPSDLNQRPDLVFGYVYREGFLRETAGSDRECGFHNATVATLAL